MNVTGVGNGVSATTWSGASRPMGGEGASGRMQTAMATLASLTSTSTADVAAQMQSGKSLAAIASASGVSRSDLIAKIADAVKANAPQGANAISDDLATRIASRIVSHHGHRHGGGVTSPTAIAPISAPSTSRVSSGDLATTATSATAATAAPSMGFMSTAGTNLWI